MSTANPAGKRLSAALPYLLVALAVVLAFRAAPFLGFVDYDDPLIVTNAALNGGLSLEAVRHAFTSTSINLWHPLTLLSHALDFTLYGDWPGGHHLTNVLIHLASCLLLLAWLRRYGGAPALALAAALLFAVHPLRVESVVWVAERKDVLSVFFYLLAVWFYSAWATAPSAPTDRVVPTSGSSSAGRRRRLYLLAVLAAMLGALSKPSLMTLPAALLLVDLWPLRRLSWEERSNWPLLRARLLEKIPFALLAFAAALVAWATWSGNQFIGEPPRHSLFDRAGFAGLAYLRYLADTFVPAGLVAFDPYPRSVPALGFAGAILLGGASVWILRRHRSAPWLFFGWFWFLGTILPGSGLVTISDHFAPDRYTYLGHAGLFVALVWLAAAAGRRWLGAKAAAATGWTALALAVFALIHLTDRQTRVWEDPESLWTHALAHTEANHVAHNQLGLALLQRGERDEGVSQLRASIAARPGFPVAVGNLALTLAREGEIREGLRMVDEAGPNLPERGRFLSELLGLALADEDDALAAELWDRLVVEYADSVGTLVSAGDFHYRTGDPGKALDLYLEATRLAPGNVRAALSAATLLLQRGSAAEALPLLQRAAESSGDAVSGAETRRTLAQAHLLLGDWPEVIEHYAKALELAPENHLLRNEVAQFLLDCPDPALRDPQRALELAKGLFPPPAPGEDGGRSEAPGTAKTPEGEQPQQRGSAAAESNPRYLRTLARAWQAAGEEPAASETAAAGLKAVESLAAADPLPEPWTPEELAELGRWFQALAP